MDKQDERLLRKCNELIRLEAENAVLRKALEKLLEHAHRYNEYGMIYDIDKALRGESEDTDG